MASELEARQRESLWLDGRPGLATPEEAAAFLAEVTIALRYGATVGLPMASMFRATQRHFPRLEDEQRAHKRAFELTNALMADGSATEVSVLANRLTLVHERVLPALYHLARDNRAPDDLDGLSNEALGAYELIAREGTSTAGDVRRLLGVAGERRPDAADRALSELQGALLVDRGPSGKPGAGVFYLTREGYPYRLFHEAHPSVLEGAGRLTREQAARQLLLAYLSAALFGSRRSLRKIFSPLLTEDQIDAAANELQRTNTVESIRVPRDQLIVLRAAD